jgi:putative ABC transport system permease protein
MRFDPQRPSLQPVSHGYLPALGSRLIAGRMLAPGDSASAPPVLVISRSVAQHFFGGANPIGQFVDWSTNEGASVPAQVAGVVENVRNQTPGCDECADVFVDYRQVLAFQERSNAPASSLSQTFGYLSFAVRAKGNPSSLATSINTVVRAVDRNAGVDALMPMERLVATSVARPRFYAVMLGIFAAVAGFLAAIGIYGVLAYAVVQRRQEIGIRMALGAQRGEVLGLVLRQGLTLSAIGIAAGIVGAAAGARLLRGMLFGITPLDPETFVAVSLLFGVVATLASYLPARHATLVDPMVALRRD